MTQSVLGTISQLLLFFLVFGLAGSVDTKAFIKQLDNKTGIMVGLGCQFLVLPFIGFCTVKLFNLRESDGITLLVVTSSPGGSFSNWWCSLFNSDLSLSIAMTTASTLLSMGMLPLNLIIYIESSYAGRNVTEKLDWADLFIAVAIVIAAIASGLLTSYKYSNHEKSEKYRVYAGNLGNVTGITLIVMSFFASSSGGTPIWARDIKFYVSTAFPCVMGLILAAFVTSLPCFNLTKPERATVCVECCFQNVGIAQVMALTMFKDEEMASAVGVPVFYGAVEAIAVGLFMVIMWRIGWSYAHPKDAIWTVIMGNYQDAPRIQKENNWKVSHLHEAMRSRGQDERGCLDSALSAPLALRKTNDGQSNMEVQINQSKMEVQINESKMEVQINKNGVNDVTVVHEYEGNPNQAQPMVYAVIPACNSLNPVHPEDKVEL